jgi:hypothetical protein
MRALRTNPAPVPSSCEECAILDICGGWDDARREKGCFQKCADCFRESCDYTCPANPALFAKSVDEVGGLGRLPDRLQLSGELKLPGYIPQIYHGSKRSRVLKEAVVSLPLHHLCRWSKYGRLELKYRSRDAMLADLKLSRRTKILITCVAKDRWIEGLYEARKQFLPALKTLGPAAVTVPNFSFVRDSPRTNSIWNQTKAFRVMEAMSDAGLDVIPHLQAQTARDWERLEDLYARFPDCKHACMEFQTGLQREDPDHPMRETYKEHFRKFQESTGGRVHPVVLAGYREIGFLSDICPSFSIIDANVFMKTVHFQEATLIPGGGRRRWRQANLAHANDLSKLLESNIEIERGFLFGKHGLNSDGRPMEPFLLPAA